MKGFSPPNKMLDCPQTIHPLFGLQSSPAPATVQNAPSLALPAPPLRIQPQRCNHMIKKVAGGYKVLSENGKKNLGGPYKTKKEAEKRLRQVEFFKHRKG
jgi:hypothetical protein